NSDLMPPESIDARRIEAEQATSVVRLRVTRTQNKKGRGTGFIVANTANKLVVMTCGHSFHEWVRGTEVGITFHDRRDASAEAVLINKEEEVALLMIDTSSNPELCAYPVVTFSYEDIRVGDFLVMLGHPHGMRGYHDVWNNFGWVTKEVGLTATGLGSIVQMFSGDFGTGPDASGSPVFGVDGRLVGMSIAGVQDMAYVLSVRWIWETLLKGIAELKRTNVIRLDVNCSCSCILDLCFC
uniref:Serine protease n=2 Tax=Setaria italica TaxID=4555 RepID=K3XQQ9_SETIT